MEPIRQIRTIAGLSLREVSRRTGIDPANLSRIERGLSPVYPGHERRIAAVLCDALGIDVERL